MDDWKQIALTMLLAMTLLGYRSLVGAAMRGSLADGSPQLALSHRNADRFGEGGR